MNKKYEERFNQFEQKLRNSSMPPNESQMEAILGPLGVSLTGAGPGTGKTHTIARRLERLALVERIPQDRILGLSRTIKASGELRRRIDPELKQLKVTTLHSPCRSLISKYYRYNEDLLFYCEKLGLTQPYYSQQKDPRNYDPKKVPVLEYKKEGTKEYIFQDDLIDIAIAYRSIIESRVHDITSPDMYNIEEVRSVYNEAYEFTGHISNEIEDYKIWSNIQELISSIKLANYSKENFGVNLEQQDQIDETAAYLSYIRKQWDDKRATVDPDFRKELTEARLDDPYYRSEDVETTFLKIKQDYEDICRQLAYLDFTDQLTCAHDLLKLQEVRETAQYEYDGILVDEFQDTDPVQFHIIKILAEYAKDLFCVGDQNQEIYQFAGAAASYVYKELGAKYKYFLSINYRSTQRIINASYSVLGYKYSLENPDREDRAESYSGELGKPVQRIRREDLENLDFSEPETYLCVCRTGKNVGLLIREFRYLGVPYISYNRFKKEGTFCISDRAAQRFINLYNFLVNPNRETALPVLDLIKKLGSGKEYETIRSMEHSFFTSIDNVVDFILDKTYSTSIEVYREFFKNSRSSLKNSDSDSFLDSVFYCSINKKGFNDRIWNFEKEVDQERNKKSLGFYKMVFDPFIKKGIPFTLEDLKNRAVELRTIHSAKGLEAEKVIVYCGDYPNDHVLGNVLYVALSRAEKELYVIGYGNDDSVYHKNLWTEIEKQEEGLDEQEELSDQIEQVTYEVVERKEEIPSPVLIDYESIYKDDLPKMAVINKLKESNGYESYSVMYRYGLSDLATEIMRDGHLLYGRSMEDGSYYYGLPVLWDNLDIPVRWLKEVL